MKTTCHHCGRDFQSGATPETDDGSPCPGCASLGHLGPAFDCQACREDPGPGRAGVGPSSWDAGGSGVRETKKPAKKKAAAKPWPPKSASWEAQQKIVAVLEALDKLTPKEIELADPQLLAQAIDRTNRFQRAAILKVLERIRQ